MIKGDESLITAVFRYEMDRILEQIFALCLSTSKEDNKFSNEVNNFEVHLYNATLYMNNLIMSILAEYENYLHNLKNPSQPLKLTAIYKELLKDLARTLNKIGVLKTKIKAKNDQKT